MTTNDTSSNGNGHAHVGPKRKLSVEQERQLHDDWLVRKLSRPALARKFGVSMATVHNTIERVSTQ